MTKTQGGAHGASASQRRPSLRVSAFGSWRTCTPLRSMPASGDGADYLAHAPCVPRSVPHATEVSRKEDGQGSHQDSLRGEQPGAGRSHDHLCVAMACTERGSIANRALPFFFSLILFSLVLVLQLPQKSPRDNHGQEETLENAKGDVNRDHRIIEKTPNSPSKRTIPPIIDATITTLLLSKCSAITTPTHSYSASTLSTHEVPPNSRTPLPDLSGYRQDNP